MSYKGNRLDNAYIKSISSPYKAKCFYVYSFKTADEVKEAVHHYIYVYSQQGFQKNETI
ncbi:IS3 family transposase [Bacillus toyonensis]|uniref:IS3 family transposase n=1 Tax=Bacillus toyonensis TaxID=155322 RepID=UPI0011461076